MKSTRATEIKVGITALAALLLIIMVLTWAKNADFYSDKINLSIKFNNVAGLATGDVVSVNGVRKGYVDNITVQGSDVIVAAVMDSDTKLQKDAKFSIMMLDLMGGKKIEITPGLSNEAIDYTKVHNGVFAGDISSAMVTLHEVQGDIVSVIQEVKTSLKFINKFTGDQELLAQFKQSVSNLETLSFKVNSLISENREQVKSLIANTNELVTNTNQVLQENRESIPQLTSSLQKTLNSADSMLVSINSLIAETREGDNNLGKFLYDEGNYSKLSLTVDKADSLLSIIIKQLNEGGVKVDADIF